MVNATFRGGRDMITTLLLILLVWLLFSFALAVRLGRFMASAMNDDLEAEG